MYNIVSTTALASRMTDSSIRNSIDNGPMSPFLVSTVALSIYCNFVTGFSILILPFTLPAIASSRLSGVMIEARWDGMDL